MKKCVSEFVGTFTLVLFGCGTAAVAGGEVGVVGIAFGFALIAMAYGVGPVSGCHINPAVSLGAFAASRMKFGELVGYIISQCLGSILADFVLMTIMKGQEAGYDVAAGGLGENGWGVGYGGGFGFNSALIFELIATFLFVVVILGSTQEGGSTYLAGLAIGISLVVIHLLGIQITGTSVNPARSLGPALFVGGKALSQLWLFLVMPSAGCIIAGIAFRVKLLGK